jgi:hypothetical protein
LEIFGLAPQEGFVHVEIKSNTTNIHKKNNAPLAGDRIISLNFIRYGFMGLEHQGYGLNIRTFQDIINSILNFQIILLAD